MRIEKGKELKGIFFKFPLPFISLLKILSEHLHMTMTDIVIYSTVSMVKEGSKFNLVRNYALSLEKKMRRDMFADSMKEMENQINDVVVFEDKIQVMFRNGANNDMVKEYCAMQLIKVETSFSEKIRLDMRKKVKAIIKKHFPFLVSQIDDLVRVGMKEFRSGKIELSDDLLVNNWKTANEYLKEFKSRRGETYLGDTTNE